MSKPNTDATAELLGYLRHNSLPPKKRKPATLDDVLEALARIEGMLGTLHRSAGPSYQFQPSNKDPHWDFKRKRPRIKA